MPKISISVPEELLAYLDGQGGNRSQIVVTILREHLHREQAAALARAYTDYAAFCAEDDPGWWPDWERSALTDADSHG